MTPHVPETQRPPHVHVQEAPWTLHARETQWTPHFQGHHGYHMFQRLQGHQCSRDTPDTTRSRGTTDTTRLEKPRTPLLQDAFLIFGGYSVTRTDKVTVTQESEQIHRHHIDMDAILNVYST